MILNDLQLEHLERVSVVQTQLARWEGRVDRVRQEARQAALDALEVGVPQSRVAEALGKPRMTLWRWLHDVEATSAST